ncbi:MAG: hypothetical protein ACTS6A_00565, partial [Candidatus Hodgkinia cicadicola]
MESLREEAFASWLRDAVSNRRLRRWPNQITFSRIRKRNVNGRELESLRRRIDLASNDVTIASQKMNEVRLKNCFAVWGTNWRKFTRFDAKPHEVKVQRFNGCKCARTDFNRLTL